MILFRNLKSASAVKLGTLSCLAAFASTSVHSQQVEYTVGIGAMYESDYEGSDDYETTVVPLIEISVNDRIKFSTLNGPQLSLHVWESSGISFDAGVGYSFGRDATDNVALGGLGNIDNSATFLAAVAYEVDVGAGRMNFGFDLERELKGNRKGTQVGLEAGYDLPVFSQRGMLSFAAGSTWADDNYMASTFGVSAAQAIASTAGLNAYSAKAGFKDITLSATLAYQMTDSMTVVGELGLTRLVGDAELAPPVKDFGSRDQKFAKLGVMYSW